MTQGLPAARLIQVAWSITSAFASANNVNSMVIVGDSAVIDLRQRMRSYAGLAEVGADFGGTAPEYLAAAAFFAQSPTPAQLFIGRWASQPTAAVLMGGALTSVQQGLGNFTGVGNGGFRIAVGGGTAVTVSGIDLSGVTSLSAVAAAIDTALAAASVAAHCRWTGSQFVLATTATGAAAGISLLSAPASGADLSALLNATSASGGYVVAGAAAETPLQAIMALDNLPTYWWCATWACATPPADSDYEAVAAYLEGQAIAPHMQGIVTGASTAITGGNASDIGAVLQQAGYQRSFGFWSASNPYAAAGAMGDLLTTNLNAANSIPTLQWKTITGATPDDLTSAQAGELDGKGYNYFTRFTNGAAIIVNGQCFGPAYIDEIFGLDWLAGQIQTNLFNLFTSVPKIPQTDAGMVQITNILNATLQTGVNNGLIGPGQWNAAGFGALSQGDQLPLGYYVYIPPLASQAPDQRAKRITPPIQIAVKLAGAVDTVDCMLTVNR